MIRIYFPEPFAGYRKHPILYKKTGVDIDQLGIETKVQQFNLPHEEVSDPALCDIMLVPHSFGTITPALQTLLKKQYESLKQHGKPYVITLFGDRSDESHLPFGIILKVSAYRDTIRPNEYVIPAYSEDWSDSEGFRTLPKGDKPVISFCGMAGFETHIRYFKYLAKIALSAFDQTRAPGIYFRRRLLSLFKKSSLFETNFIVRTSFSSAKATLKEASYADVRKDFYDSVTSSHFVIAPKGDGNYSNRFFETLSLGRTPVCPDTKIVLPLENVLDYKKYCVIEPIARISNLPETVQKFYATIPDIEKHQRDTQRFYKENLRFDACFMKILRIIHDTHHPH